MDLTLSKRPIRFLLVLLAGIIIWSAGWFFTSTQETSMLTPWSTFNAQQETELFEEASVVRVVDGDTIVVSINGTEEEVRLIGINCPESVHPDESRNTEDGMTASDFTRRCLSEGKSVWLQKDVSEIDQYGRLLRYVWMEKPGKVASADEIKAKMLNAILLTEGQAVPVEYPPDTKYSEIFDSFSRQENKRKGFDENGLMVGQHAFIVNT